MEAVVNKIEKIQNKRQSLRWGHHAISDGEIMFAVGNTAYPKEPHFFTVTSDNTVYLLSNDHKRNLHKQCVDIADVAAEVIVLLKEWFPAK
jgi:hypothetical protein